MLLCPWCKNINYGGMSSPFYALLSSTSTEKSQIVSLLSAELTARTESSPGSNCKLVIACVCHLIRVMESNVFCSKVEGFNMRRSHIRNSPLSSPEARRNLLVVFQLITFTSQSWALNEIYAFIYVALRSQSLTVWSTEQDASTCS